MTDFLVVSGVSGAGRSSAADSLEDLGWFVIDNLPAVLYPKIGDLAAEPGSDNDRVALVIGGDPSGVDAIDALRQAGLSFQVLYLDASTDTLVRRYDSTRRRHPRLGAGSLNLAAAIEAERELLAPVRAVADVVIDTSDLNIHAFRERMVDLFRTGAAEAGMRTHVVSFGYKHGLPRDVDLVFDCRFLPNPYWVESLRPYTGLDAPVRDFVLGQPITQTFLEQVDQLLETLLPAYASEGKAYLSVAVGCTGGRHRSVAIAEELAHRLRSADHKAEVVHRDLDK